MFLFWSCDRPTSSCMFFAGEASEDVKTPVSVYFLSITVRFALALFLFKREFECLERWTPLKCQQDVVIAPWWWAVV